MTFRMRQINGEWFCPCRQFRIRKASVGRGINRYGMFVVALNNTRIDGFREYKNARKCVINNLHRCKCGAPHESTRP